MEKKQSNFSSKQRENKVYQIRCYRKIGKQFILSSSSEKFLHYPSDNELIRFYRSCYDYYIGENLRFIVTELVSYNIDFIG